MLTLPNGRKVGELAPGDQQIDAGIAETEGGEPAELRAQAERQGLSLTRLDVKWAATAVTERSSSSSRCASA